jgi:hypothetical protein
MRRTSPVLIPTRVEGRTYTGKCSVWDAARHRRVQRQGILPRVEPQLACDFGVSQKKAGCSHPHDGYILFSRSE